MNDKNDLSIDTEKIESELENNLGTGITINKKGTNNALLWEIIKDGYIFEIKEEGKVATNPKISEGFKPVDEVDIAKSIYTSYTMYTQVVNFCDYRYSKPSKRFIK